MTERAQRIEHHARAVDFTALTNSAAVARIRQLAAQGLREDTLQLLSGWNRTDVWRAMTPAPARPDA